MQYSRQRDGEDLEAPESAKNKSNLALISLISVVVFVLGFTLTVIILFPGSMAKKKQPDVVSPKSVFMLSIDGFRADYVEKYCTSCPNICERLFKGNNHPVKRSGVRAKKMIPIFPSKTFPNHFTLATGLYAEDHGIIANTIYDPQINEVFTMDTTDPKWWQGGEPIWTTCEKQNITSAVYYFPGANIKIRDYLPTYYASNYDESVNYTRRIDTLLGYLEEDRKPRLFMSYFEGVDTAGHRYGPDSQQVRDAIMQADHAVGYLIDQLEKRNMLATTNIIIVSDHGMMNVPNTQLNIDEIYPEFTSDAKSYNYGTFMDVYPHNASDVERIYKKLIAARAEDAIRYDHFDVYTRETMPDRYHFSKNRLIPPILITARPGWHISISSVSYPSKGDHGYDNQIDEMGATFIANGPDFKADASVQEPFENVNVYSLVTHLFNITESPNKGSWERVKYLLKL
jgi:predicted AlkP superfamily pyrophosphatase or phosphodiesterase